MDKISIIIPVYNAEKYINQCIDSVLSQTYKNIELFLVDDGSTDGSAMICDKYAEEDSRVKVIHQINSGCAKARNTGIEQASGDWILFLDSDDWLEADTCEVLMQTAISQDADQVVCGYYDQFVGRVVNVGLDDGEVVPLEDRKQLVKDIIGYQNGIGEMYPTAKYPWGKLVRRRVIDEYRLRFSEYILPYEDTIWSMQVLWRAKFTVRLNRLLFHYREVSGSLSKQSTQDLLDNGIKVAEELGKIKEFEQVITCEDYGAFGRYLIMWGKDNIHGICGGNRKKMLAYVKKYLDSGFYRDAIELLDKKQFKEKYHTLYLYLQMKTIKMRYYGLAVVLLKIRYYIKLFRNEFGKFEGGKRWRSI